jgi:thiol:disulfide interchange protein DsbD
MRSFLHRLLAVLLLCACAAAPAWAVDESDLLPVDQAFALSASASPDGGIALHWKIAPGYYLYRERIHVQALDGFDAGALQLPPGARHHDEFFGDVQTYRDQVVARLPGKATAPTATLKVKYQGCADLGVCYPPQTRTLNVALPATPDAASTASAAAIAPAADGLAALGRALAGGGVRPAASPGAMDAQPLPPEQAFGFEAIVGDGRTLLLRFTPARGYYLYRDKTSVRVSGAEGIAAGALRWPPGVAHHDEHFGDVVVYFDQVDVPLALQRRNADAADITVTATFQGCQTDGICYPPMTRSVALALPAAAAIDTRNAGTPAATVAAAMAPSSMAGTATGDPASTSDGLATAVATTGDDANARIAGQAPAAIPSSGQAEDSRLAAGLAGSNRWLALLGFFGAGLLLAFTPCVLPMIPILSGLIAGQGTRLGTGRALLLSLVYVLANALVFTLAGVVAGLLGANLQAAFQQPWIIAAFAALFVVLALSSFGLYQLQLPMALRARLGAWSGRQHGGSLAGVATMGALSALIVGPCVAPPLAGAVLYIGQAHDPVLGGAALFLLAMGMGLPLLAFGAAAGRGMPTSGPWMTAVERVFGLVFLGLAVWMLARILPGPVTLALWGLLALGAAAWASMASSAAAGASARGRLLARFAALVLGVAGAAQLFGALAGGSDPLQPLAGVGGTHAATSAPVFDHVKSSADLDRAVAAASAAGRPLMLDFYADWCVSCKEMEKYTFTDPDVRAALSGFVLLKADVTANDAVDQALMRRFGIIGPPGTLFFAGGSEQRGLRLVGFEKVAPFVQRLQRARTATP